MPNSEQSYKGKVKTHNYINRQNQSTTENCENVVTMTWYRYFLLNKLIVFIKLFIKIIIIFCSILSGEKRIYFPFNFIVFSRYLDLNYRCRLITRTGIFSTFIGITFVRNEIFSWCKFHDKEEIKGFNLISGF